MLERERAQRRRVEAFLEGRSMNRTRESGCWGRDVASNVGGDLGLGWWWASNVGGGAADGCGDVPAVGHAWAAWMGLWRLAGHDAGGGTCGRRR